VFGNAAYEAGNIGGATLGLEAVFGTSFINYYPGIIGVFAFLLLFLGNYRALEKGFIVLVLVMSLSFLITALITKPDMVGILKGIFIPSAPEESLLMIAALVGTTVVPYNLFLHASLVGERWKSKSDLKAARTDSVVSILLGGVVSMAVIVAAAAIPDKQISNAMDLAKGLEPLYGNFARYCMGIGLFAAGVTSAITAPLAAAYVADSCFGWKTGLKNFKFRIVWMTILILGVIFMSLGIRPIAIIQFAQVANGILLPVIAIFLLWAVNRTSVMGKYKNSTGQNIAGLLIVIFSLLLGTKSILRVFEVF
ncbi:MAG: Nramp family divalent metal transporter, partial [Pricia sp.]|nr:Nramp family divalent metal transporter [Pricia sp.]